MGKCSSSERPRWAFRTQKRPSPAMLALRNTRMVWSPESDKDCHLSPSLVRRLTGGDELHARGIYKEQATFRPTHTMFMLTNHLPKLDPDDFALRERVKVVPFDQMFVEKPNGPNQHHRDPHLFEKLKAESSMILTWMVQGALKYVRENKMPECPAVSKATQDYFSSLDVVGRFVEECCSIGDGLKLKAGDAYKAFQSWCEDEGHESMSSTKFGEKFTNLFEKKRVSVGYFYFGVDLK